MSRSSLDPPRRMWLATVAAAVIVAGGVGYGVARLTAPAEEAGHGAEGAEAHADEAKAGSEAGHAEEAPEGSVAMTAERIRVAGIQVVAASGGALAAEVTAQATVTAEPNGEAVLAARADGVVTRIERRLGDFVRAGDPVATIESRDAAAIAAERATAGARLTQARQTFAREKRLFEAKISPRQDLEAAQVALAEAEAESRRATSAAAAARVAADGRSVSVVSPISGRVTASSVVLGAYVTGGAELFRVADATRIAVQAAVPALDARRVAPGDRATLEAPGHQPVAATVRSITPGLDAESRAATVVLTLTGDASGLRPGQAGRVRITTQATAGGPARVVVPEEAVQSVEGRDVVFVRTNAGFRAQPVTVATRGGGRAEIAGGLAAGQAVAGQGAFLVKAELGKGDAEHGH